MVKIHKKSDALLLLEDDSVFYGTKSSIDGFATGELCFNTGLTGYQEMFTDPSYYGQILINTNVHIGNYGIKFNDNESNKIQIKGLICKKYELLYSRYDADMSLQEYLFLNKIIVISDIDTRSLVKYISNNGSMNCIIATGNNIDIAFYRNILKNQLNYINKEFVPHVSTKSIYYYGSSNSTYKIAVLDFGVKKSMLECLSINNIYMKVFPYNTLFDEIYKWNPDGYFISNGPGDPSIMIRSINLIKKLINTNKVVFGICLGHQLISLANGLKTYKMYNGHRGTNHPVKNIENNTCAITTQNHGFAIDKDSLKNNSNIVVTHINLNDNTIEGIKMKNKPVFSVQYHPEASPGPHDSRYLFKKFLTLLCNNK